MIVKAKHLQYGQKFKVDEPTKPYILRHKKPLGLNAIALYTDRETFIIDEDDLVKIIPTAIMYKQGSVICACLCINPLFVERCLNRECRKRIYKSSKPDYLLLPETLKRRAYQSEYYKTHRLVNKKVDLNPINEKIK